MSCDTERKLSDKNLNKIYITIKIFISWNETIYKVNKSANKKLRLMFKYNILEFGF